MRVSAWFLAGLTLTCVLMARGVNAQAEAGQSDPVWVAYPDIDLEFERIDLGGGQVAEIGDPRLGAWAVKQAGRARNLSYEALLRWLRVVELYRVHEAEPAVMALIGRLKLNDASEKQWRMYAAASMIATDKSKDKLKQLIKLLDEYPKDHDSRRRAHHKVRLAAALVRLGDADGRELLLDYFKQGKTTGDGFQAENYDAVERVLDAVWDPKLYKVLELLKDEPALEDKPIESILEEMALIGRPLDELWEAAEDRENDENRGAVIAILAERAGHEDLRRMRDLLPARRAGAPGSSRYQRFLEYRNKALILMACRHWRELIED